MEQPTQFNFNVEFKNQEAKTLFLNLEEVENQELTAREQIEIYKQNLSELIEYFKQEKVKSRNRQLIRNGLHPLA